MNVAARALVGLVAVEHLWFLILEMFLWRTPFGRRTFGMSVEQAEASWRLAANQGLYNGFLAAGLGWSVIAPAGAAYALSLFFLGCVLTAGIFGGLTAKRSILVLQALPAAVALALVIAANR